MNEDTKSKKNQKEKKKLKPIDIVFKVINVFGFCLGFIIASFVFNTILPSMMADSVRTVEIVIKNLTGISFDIVGDAVGDKPVIYIYSDKDNKDVNVRIDTNEKITVTYPKAINNGWSIKADKDGTIRDKGGLEYNYLFWESEYNNIKWDWSKGFCVKGSESKEFLDKALEEIGLNRKEANEFIVYWLPRLEKNEYNLISFQSQVYEDVYKLDIDPVPDKILRVFMTFKGMDNAVEIETQDLNKLKGEFKREGFYVVEWGGSEVH